MIREDVLGRLLHDGGLDLTTVPQVDHLHRGRGPDDSRQHEQEDRLHEVYSGSGTTEPGAAATGGP